MQEYIETEIAKFYRKEHLVIKKYKSRYLYLMERIPFSKLKVLNSKNIIKLIDFNIKNNESVYEFFESKTMDKFFMYKSIEFNDLLVILKQLAGGIDELHNNNLIHNDIRMRNILISDNCQIKINDFDFLKTKKNNSMKLIDIYSFANLVFRLISVKHEWSSISHLDIKYQSKNLNYSSCLNFLSSLQLEKV